ncbi:hypothetical protein VHEMI10078 [[Torrubiella] hemipterigena]|uniref:Uncharacterized protein n=1 Tax=[Torrubiella] hemipterigena TaxID=1531966 RepID=A0A0A1TR76_9HYPO|nr:hypothetical protein VHEMI10078 [[Torrubiella] hemipterigena]
MNSHGRMYKATNQHKIDARKRNHESAFTQPSANGNRVMPENMARPGARTPANGLEDNPPAASNLSRHAIGLQTLRIHINGEHVS